MNLDGVTVEEALQQVLSANGYYYKVINQRTIIVIPDQPAKHQQYDELVVKVFYISHADATELAQLVNSIMRIPQMAVQPMMMPNKAANTITVRATAPVDGRHRADHPRERQAARGGRARRRDPRSEPQPR